MSTDTRVMARKSRASKRLSRKASKRPHASRAKPRKAKAKPARAKAKTAKPAKPAPLAAKPAPLARRARRRLPRRALPARPLKPGDNPFDAALPRRTANYQPLSPLSFLERASRVFPEVTAIVHGKQRISYAAFYARARKLASALSQRKIGKGDVVSVLLANTPAMLEAHHGVPMAGAVLHSINTRLDAATVGFMLDHANAKAFIVDLEFAGLAQKALENAKVQPLVIAYDDKEFPQAGKLDGALDYESFLAGGDGEFVWALPADEWNGISLNYTSGTTGNPKGVVYHHRGAALMGYSNLLAAGVGPRPVYLWTLPMFHCNGWCFPWTLSLVAGTHVCLRWVRAKDIYNLIAQEKVTHLCGAPIVMSTLLNATPDERKPLPHVVQFTTAAAPPPEAVLAGMAEAGFNVTHVYGLTETYGPATVNEWKPEWDALPSDERAAKKARQGVTYPSLEHLAVLDPATMEPVPADGETLGEVMFRGNIVMKGYLKNPKASEEAFAGGWFHSGDLGVVHPDGYIQLKDRSKDIIISGGENISSIEVEDALYKHPAVMFAAVVGRADEKWGETPCAFIERRVGHETVSESDIVAFCREHIARFKVPSRVVFGELPKTSTGKIQKYVLRERAKNLP
jgi:fatty-acyl-CoA synthase